MRFNLSFRNSRVLGVVIFGLGLAIKVSFAQNAPTPNSGTSRPKYYQVELAFDFSPRTQASKRRPGGELGHGVVFVGLESTTLFEAYCEAAKLVGTIYTGGVKITGSEDSRRSRWTVDGAFTADRAPIVGGSVHSSSFPKPEARAAPICGVGDVGDDNLEPCDLKHCLE